MFKDNEGPLMYINSVQTPNNQKFGQQVYDSRKPIKIISNNVSDNLVNESIIEDFLKEENKVLKLSDEEIILLEKIIMLNKNALNVRCEFYFDEESKDYNNVVGAPVYLEQNFLKIDNQGSMIELDLFRITKYLIV